MPEDVETVAADSSPAAAPEAKPEIPKDAEGYAEWRTTGKIPEKKSADDKSGKAAPVSETGDKQRKDRSGEERKQELKREIEELLTQRSQLRSEVNGSGKSDVKAESSTAAAPAKSDVKKAEPSTAPATGDKRPIKPKQDDFDDWSAYEAAQDKYVEDLADWRAAEKLRDYETRKAQEAANADMQRRLDAAKARYGEDAETKVVDTAKTVFNDQEVAPAIKTALGRSAVLVDALYVMGGDQKQFSEFLELAKKDPLEALRKWYKIEELVEAQVAKNAASEPDEAPRSPDGKFLPQRKAREAPAPRTELGGVSSPPGDDRTRAANHGDFRSFKADADRRELARLRGQ